MFKKIVVLGLSALVFTTAACSVDANEPSASTSEALDNGSGGAGEGAYCNSSGYCQCSGLAQCDDMFQYCKSGLYCNQDASGLRCCCLNFVPLTTSPTRTITAPTTTSRLAL